jgi:hypothetical protein
MPRPPRSRSLGSPLLLLAVGAGVLVALGCAWAFWTALGSGNAGAGTTTLAAPGTPSASVTNGTVTLTWTAAPPPGTGTLDYRVERRVTSGSTWVDACGTSATVHITDLTCTEIPGAGTYVWRVTAGFHSWTAVSATSASTVVGTADLTPPTGSITAPSASAIVTGTSVSVTSNSADTGSGVASARFQTSPAGASTWTNLGAADTTSPYGVTWNTTTFTDGAYDLRVITTDNVGNAFTSPTVTNVRVDNTAPAVSLALAGSPTGAYLAAGKVWFKSNAAGSFKFVATVIDGGSGAASATFPALSATNWTTHANETVSTPSGGPYTSTTFSWVATGGTPGTYTITGTDAVGFTATSSVTFGADATAPTGSITAPAASANVRGSVSVTSSSADASSGVASARFQRSPAGAGTWTDIATSTSSPYTVAWDTTAIADGLYDLRVITTDNVGNTFTSSTITNVRVDNTLPTGAVTAPLAGTNVRGSAVSVTASSADGGSGVASAQFQTSPAGANTWTNLGAADTTSPYGVTWNTTTFTDGFYDLRVVTADKAGNTFTSPVTTNVRVDNTAPTILIALAPSPTGAFFAANKVWFKSNAAGSFKFVATVIDGGSGAASATFPALSATNWTTHANETVSTPSGGPYSSTTFSWVATGGTPGTYTITGTDAAGNTVTQAITFGADATAPTGSITTPAASANVRGSVSVTSSSADASSGVASARFQRSPAGAGTWTDIATSTSSLYTISWDTTAVTDGLYDLRVITTDNVGNTFTSSTITSVRVDNTAPTASVTAPVSNAAVSGSSVSLAATSTDAGSGVNNVQFQVSPSGAGTWTNVGAADTTSPYAATWNTTSGADGRFDLRAVATDNAGNPGTSATVTVEVQNGTPTPTSIALVGGGGSTGRVEQGDSIVVTFSQTMRVSTFCASWSGDSSDQSLTANGDVTVTLTDGEGSNDSLTVSSATCTFRFGAVDLGATGYVTGGAKTFSGSSASKSTVTWSAATRTLTIVLGGPGGVGTVGTVASSTAIYTPDSALKNAVGTAVTGTAATAAGPQF